MMNLKALFRVLGLLGGLGLVLTGCGEDDATQPPSSGQPPESGADAQPQTESERLNAFFEDVFDRDLDRSPMSQTYLGIKDDYDKWDDISDARATEDIELVRGDLERLRGQFDIDRLSEEDALSFRIFEFVAERTLEGDRWRYNDYPVNQMFGWQSNIPSFLINMHQVGSVDDARAYISRLHGVDGLMAQVIDNIDLRAQRGVVPPEFVFDRVIEDSRNVITGAPFTGDALGDVEDSPLLADIRGKIEALELPQDEASMLMVAAQRALLDSVGPAYEALIERMERLAAEADGNKGAWALPDGPNYYNHRLSYYTSTDLTAEEIHDIGVRDVARIHGEMEDIMAEVGFDGSLQEFFAFMREDEQFYLPNTDEGREQYLEMARTAIDGMRERLDEVFGLKPRADMIVKRVEPFREQSAGKAFYQMPALDGSRPGIFYANLYDMTEMPTYQLEALAYHEGIPGHHMQIAIKQELEDLPRFRKFAYFGAYSEGWGLYAEKLPREMGFYEDPYSDFGRLSMELWRAARLVVDTGLHHKRWTREEAVAYLDENTPNPHKDNVRSIQRYLVMPGQATSYKIGMNKILDLRDRAREAMGDDFDIRVFHDVVLRDGSLPLTVLEQQVEEWIAEETGN